jgi:hypothetical protein
MAHWKNHVRDTDGRRSCGSGGVGGSVCLSICPSGNVWAIKVGMSDQQVASIAGAPVPWLSGPRCWNYHASRPGTSIAGRTFFFTNGYVTRILTAVHA